MVNTSGISIPRVLSDWAKKQPNHTLLFAPETGRSMSYGDMAVEAEHFMGWLKERNISVAGHIGIYMHNGRQTTTVFIATMATGRVVTPLNLLAPVDQLAWVLDHSDIEILFYAPENKKSLFAALEKQNGHLNWLSLIQILRSGHF